VGAACGASIASRQRTVRRRVFTVRAGSQFTFEIHWENAGGDARRYGAANKAPPLDTTRAAALLCVTLLAPKSNFPEGK
jgi:hypothetical protein